MSEERTGPVAARGERSRAVAWIAAAARAAAVLAACTGTATATAQTAPSPVPVAADAGFAGGGAWGPIATGNDFLLAAGFLAAHPGTPTSLPAGGWEVEVGYGVANTFAKSQALNGLFPDKTRRALTPAELDAAAAGRDSLYYIDGEVSRSTVTLRHGLGNGIEVEATLPVLDIGGGYTDGLIEGFHTAFGLGQDGRLSVPRNGYTIYLRSDGRRLLATDGSGPGAGDVVLAAKSELPPPAWLAGVGFGRLAVQGLLKLPSGNQNDFYGSGSADVGIQLLASRPVGRARLDVTLAALVLGADDHLGTSSQTVAAASVAYERPLFARSSLLAQFDVSQSPLRTVHKSALTPTTYLLSLGWGHALAPHLSFVAALTENLLNYDNSADIGVHLGLRRRF